METDFRTVQKAIHGRDAVTLWSYLSDNTKGEHARLSEQEFIEEFNRLSEKQQKTFWKEYITELYPLKMVDCWVSGDTALVFAQHMVQLKRFAVIGMLRHAYGPDQRWSLHEDIDPSGIEDPAFQPKLEQWKREAGW